MLELIAATTIALSQREMSFLACMHGEDWIVSTESFDGLDEHMKNKSRELFPESQNVRTNLYYMALLVLDNKQKKWVLKFLNSICHNK